MGRRITALCTALVGFAVAACGDSPFEPVTSATPASAPFTELALPPSFTVYDGGEVNTSIAVESPIQCTERATVTVTIQGVLPPPPLLDVVLMIDESGPSVSATEWGQEGTGFNRLLEVLDQADGADNNLLARAKIGIVKDGLGENFPGAPFTQSFSDDYATIQGFINTRHRTGKSDYAGSFTRARDMFTNSGRPGSVRFVVFVTDGNGGPENSATDAANLLKGDGVRIMGIVVGGTQSDISFAATLATPDALGAQSFWGSTFPNLASTDPMVNPFYSIGNQIGSTPGPAAAATNLTFSANVPSGFTLVSGSAVASKGSASLAGNAVTWTIGTLVSETITLTFEVEHDDAAAPAGGMLTALTNARLTGTDPSGDSINESLTDKQVDVQGCDITPPVITPTVTGTLGDNGWYIGDVGISWAVNDPESAYTIDAGCAAATVDTDTGGVSFGCTATSKGGTSTQTITV
ncbi:MAG: VWA domain-containing protein [Gemmatimonadetes bacterium]|nr:VWA domain-containing protein [Gemmatimonadota bacterium]